MNEFPFVTIMPRCTKKPIFVFEHRCSKTCYWEEHLYWYNNEVCVKSGGYYSTGYSYKFIYNANAIAAFQFGLQSAVFLQTSLSLDEYLCTTEVIQCKPSD